MAKLVIIVIKFNKLLLYHNFQVTAARACLEF